MAASQPGPAGRRTSLTSGGTQVFDGTGSASMESGSPSQRLSSARRATLRQGDEGLSQELTRLDGECKSLRTQLSEMFKRVQRMDPTAAKGIAEEMAAMRAEVQNSRQVTGEVQQLQKEIRDAKALIAQLQQSSQGMGQTSNDVARLRQEMAAIDQLRHDLRSVRSQIDGPNGFTSEVTKIQQTLRDMGRDVAAMKEIQSQVKTFSKEHQDIRTQHQDIRNQMQKVQRDMAPMSDIKQELTKINKELGPLKNDSRVAKVVEKELRKLGTDLSTMKSTDLGTVKLVAQSCARELQEFKKQIYDSGVLIPKRDPPPQEQEEITPIVGTIELGEDIFSARLLLRLGWIKWAQDEKKQAREAEAEAEDGDMPEREGTARSPETRVLLIKGRREGTETSDEDSEHESSLVPFDELVSGLVIPEVLPGGHGYCEVTIGWGFVCVCVMCIQLLIVIVIITHSFSAGSDCVDPAEAEEVSKPLTVLHVAKFSAVLVAGPTMGKELMDTLNFVMISGLLEENRSWETFFAAAVRFLTILLIGVANVMMFISTTDAADVFMNMTALTFIGEMGCFGLDFAKRGVFGTYISKTMTELNFQLNLVSKYPWWFNGIRNVTLFFTAFFTVAFCGLILFVREPVCSEDGTSPNTFLTLAHIVLPFLVADPRVATP